MTTFRPAVTGAIALLVLAACTPDDGLSTTKPPATLPVSRAPAEGIKPMTCSPRAWQSLVGKQVADVRIPAALTYRVMPRDTIVTREYIENRLNIITDMQGKVLEVTCG